MSDSQTLLGSDVGPVRSRPAARARSNGWWGMALFAAAETTLVGSIIGSYFYLRFNARQWPPPGTPKPALSAPLILAVLLAAALVPFLAALSAARANRRGPALVLVAVATCIQALYLGIQVHLFATSLARFTPQQGAYASIYYVLLGADHAHVAVGLALDLWLLARLATRLTPYRLRALEAIALYWLAVVGLTVFVTATVLSVRT